MDTQEFEQKYAQLTPKLHEVLTQVLQGIPDEEIAENMGIQSSTVRKHIERIYRVLDLNSDFAKNRRSRRSDLFTLFAQHKPKLLPIAGGGYLAPDVTESYITETNVISREVGGDLASDVTEADNKTDSPPHPRNPFIPLAGRIDDSKLFFNREKEIRDIFELLKSGSHVSVVGEKGIGKSSVLQAICRETKSEFLRDRERIYLDLQPLENEDEFYMDLCDRLGIPESRGIQLKRKLNEKFKDEKFKDKDKKLLKDEKFKDKDKKLLLVMDKAEKLTEDGFIESKIAGELRGLAEGTYAPLRLVLGSSQPLDQLYKDKGKLSPFENLFIPVELKPWDEATARAFIAQRLASTPVSFTEEEISEIIDETKGHPQKLMQKCYKTYEKYLTKNNGH